MTYKERLDGKAWRAVQAMVDGLNKSKTRLDFFIDMDTYGHHVGPVCFGCAATCTIQEVAKKKLRFYSIGSHLDRKKRSKSLGICNPQDQAEFESAINQLRCGDVFCLFGYLDIGYDKIPDQYYQLPVLSTDNWKDHLHYYQTYANHLKKLDI